MSVRSVHAESTTSDDIYIGHVALVQNWKDPHSEQLIETFKHRLRDHGYKTRDCKETKQAWKEIVDEADGAIPYEEIGKKLVTAAECAVPDTAKHAYSARLILDYDPKLERRQATLYLLPLFGDKKLDATYTHKQGSLESWYQVIDRVITRAGGGGIPTTILLRMKKDADVGDVVKLDASESWDPDGEAFELHWRIQTKACVRGKDVLPMNLHDCPSGYKLEDWVVRDRVGKSDQIHELSVPQVGDYKIEVHAKIGKREEPAHRFTLRAQPRRSWVVFATQQFLRTPALLLSDREGRHWAQVQSLGVEKRFIQRLGLFGWHEEVHYGLAFGAMSPLGTKGGALTFSLVTLTRTLDRTGRYGIINTGKYGLMYFEGDRSFKADHVEWGMLLETFLGAYYAFGNNYMFQSTPYCSDLCPGIAIGPTVSGLFNYTAERFGISLGIEGQVLLEF